MFSSIAAAPASCMARAYSVHPSGVTPLRLAITGTSTADDGALEQDQVAAGAAVLLDHGGEVAERLGEALGGLLDEPDGSCRLLSQLLLEQREQNDRADAAVRQPPDAVEACTTAAMGTPRAGCAGRGPCSWSRGPSALPAGIGRELARAARRHLLVQPPALVDDLLGEAEQALGLGRLGGRQRTKAQLALAVVRQ